MDLSDEVRASLMLMCQKVIEGRLCDADLVVTASNSATPLFKGAWLKPDAFVAAVGSYTPTSRELDADTIARAHSKKR